MKYQHSKSVVRPPPDEKGQTVADSSTKFCLTANYLSEWGLSRVRSITQRP